MKPSLKPFVLTLLLTSLTSCAFFDQFQTSSSESSSSSSEEYSSIELSSREEVDLIQAIFHDYNGEILDTIEVERGKTVYYDGPSPVRPDGAKYRYRFSGWDAPLEHLRATTHFYPVFESTLRTYSVRFLSRGSLVEEQEVAFGNLAQAPYAGNFADYEEDGAIYSFIGFDKDIANTFINDDVVFTAQYARIQRGLNFAPYYDGQGEINGVMVSHYDGDDKEVVIPEFYGSQPVVSVGPYAFSGKTNLERVELPSSIRTIQDSAFSHCAALNQIVLPEGLSSIGTNVFQDTLSLESLVLKGGLTTIGYQAFASSGLVTLALPKNVTYLGERAFSNCPNLSTVDLSRCDVALSAGLFSGDGSLERIVFNDATKVLPSDLFAGCPNFTSITLPTLLSEIGDGAFSDCAALTSIVIPAHVTRIGNNAFHRCDALQSVVFEGDELEEIGSWAFSEDLKIAEIDLPNSLKRIGECAFYNTSLARLGIGDHIEYLGDGFINGTPLYDDETYLLSNIYYLISYSHESYYIYRQRTAPFARLAPQTKCMQEGIYFAPHTVSVPATLCEDLSFLKHASFDALVLEDESHYRVEGGCIYEGTTLYRCFQNLITHIDVAEGTETIATDAFADRYSLDGVTLNEGLLNIESAAFGSSSVYTLCLPDSLKHVSRNVFQGGDMCYILMGPNCKATFSDPQYDARLTVYDKYEGIQGQERGLRYFVNDGEAIGYRYSREASIVSLPEEVGGYPLKEIAPGFRFEFPDQLEEVTFPDSIERIGEGAMANAYYSIRLVKLPSALRELGSHAIYLGEGITVLPSTLREVSEFAITGADEGVTQLYCEEPTMPAYYPANFAVKCELFWYSSSPNADGHHWHYTGNKIPTLWE